MILINHLENVVYIRFKVTCSYTTSDQFLSASDLSFGRQIHLSLYIRLRVYRGILQNVYLDAVGLVTVTW